MNPKFDNLFIKANKNTRMRFGAYNGNVQLTIWSKERGNGPLLSVRLQKGVGFLRKLREGYKVVTEDNSRRYPIIHSEWNNQEKANTEVATYVVSVDEKGRFVFEVASRNLRDSPQQYIFYGNEAIQGPNDEDASNHERSKEEFEDFIITFEQVIIPSAVNSMLDYKTKNGGGGNRNDRGRNDRGRSGGGDRGGDAWG